MSHFEALGLHVITDAPPQDILPDVSFLPPFEEWRAVSADALEEVTNASKRPLSNGNQSPGVQTYQERRKELSIDNTAAFRTIRRIPAPPGETSVRLGNAYEFFKNLELFSGYWHDTSLPSPPNPSTDEQDKDQGPESEKAIFLPHLQTHQRTGTGSQLPPEYRQHLLTAFIKLVAYDFGCNVSFPRCEPRLHLTPNPKSMKGISKPPSYFNSSTSFIYRTPSDRASARTGIVEGPVAAVSCRTSTVFATPAESRLDLAREIVALILTAQQRAREHKTEFRFGEGKWWTTVPRWGGGSGGPIGKEADRIEEVASPTAVGKEEKLSTTTEVPPHTIDPKRSIGGIAPTPPSSKRPKKSSTLKEGNMAIYENYRKMLPPSSTWDRKARYCAIGKVEGGEWDDVFLVSALNHHVCVLRARVPNRLLGVLDGEEGEWGGVKVWRSKWFDLFLREERIEGMELVWGMMSWLMRKTNVEGAKDGGGEVDSEKLDWSQG